MGSRSHTVVMKRGPALLQYCRSFPPSTLYSYGAGLELPSRDQAGADAPRYRARHWHIAGAQGDAHDGAGSTV
jgi:hypothetical protein